MPSLLPPASCLLPPASCLLPPASCPPASCLRSSGISSTGSEKLEPGSRARDRTYAGELNLSYAGP
eukprot:1892525-Rhodomonas_salina.1